MTETCSLRVSTIVKAPRHRVFAAWTNADTLRQWFAPGTRRPDPTILDVRVGGQFRITMAGKDDAPTATGRYQEVIEGEKLVFTWSWEGDPSQPTLVTVSFADVAEGTEVVLTHERFISTETRDHHRQGWQGILDKLGPLFGDEVRPPPIKAPQT